VLVIPPGGRRRAGAHDVVSAGGQPVAEASLDKFLKEMKGLLAPVR